MADKKEISFTELDKLLEFHCTLEEVAGWFRVSPDTVERRIREKFDKTFAEYSAEKEGSGKASLRRKMWQLALKGSGCIPLLIFLSKQHLGYADKSVVKAEDLTDAQLAKAVEDRLRRMGKAAITDHPDASDPTA